MLLHLFGKEKDPLAIEKEKLEKKLKEAILLMGEKTKLRDACEYSLLGEGKRVRPILTMVIADSIGKKRDVTFSALAVVLTKIVIVELDG